MPEFITPVFFVFLVFSENYKLSYQLHFDPAIMTGNASEDFCMLKRYQNTLGTFVGPTKILISSDTLQVKDYSRYNWTMFDPEKKKARYEEVFPLDKQKAFQMGAELVGL